MDLEKEGFLFEKVEQFLKNEALTQVHWEWKSKAE